MKIVTTQKDPTGAIVEPVEVSSHEVLGQTVRGAIDFLVPIPIPTDKPAASAVTMTQEEFTSMCPVTGQPDFGTVSIEFIPDEYYCESKSLKLWLQQWRDKGAFCEQLAVDIADGFMQFIKPLSVYVTVTQRPRGGISIRAQATRVKRSAS